MPNECQSLPALVAPEAISAQNLNNQKWMEDICKKCLIKYQEIERFSSTEKKINSSLRLLCLAVKHHAMTGKKPAASFLQPTPAKQSTFPKKGNCPGPTSHEGGFA
jgi:hypothetical protein